jgi:hypothetical protein
MAMQFLQRGDLIKAFLITIVEPYFVGNRTYNSGRDWIWARSRMGDCFHANLCPERGFNIMGLNEAHFRYSTDKNRQH